MKKNRRITDRVRGIWKIFLIILLILLILLLMADAADVVPDVPDAPRIENFSIVLDGGGYKLSFAFANLKGGLAEAIFTIGCQIYRDGNLISEVVQKGQLNLVDEVKVVQLLMSGSIETGKFQAFAPVIREKDLKSGDKIVYFILVIDGAGRKSNGVIYEYNFVEKWII